MIEQVTIIDQVSFEEFCDTAGVALEHRHSTYLLLVKIGSLSITNPHTGILCLAKRLPSMLMEQAF